MTSVPVTTYVELTVRCENLQKEDVSAKFNPTCIFFNKSGKLGFWLEVGRTEKILDSSSPRWTKKFLLKYRFERRLEMRFDVLDTDSETSKLSYQDPLGSVECSLGEVMAGQNGGFSRPLERGGVMFVHAEEISANKNMVTFTLEGRNLDKKDFFGKSDPFFEISSMLTNDSTMVYRSEVIPKCLNPCWQQVEMDSRRLCNSDFQRTLRVDVYDEDSDKSRDLIGTFTTTLERLLKGPGPENEYKCINEKKKKKDSKYQHSGIVSLTQIHSVRHYSFLDFIFGGLQLNFTVAIDFTVSNGQPSHPSSLHYNGSDDIPNQYVTAIQAVGTIIQEYDTDKVFPSFGFGAKVPPNNQVSHEFFLSLDPSRPSCAGLEGILEAYQTALNCVQLYGPTNFCPLIRQVAKIAEQHREGISNYFVLLIITDGLITDFEETKALLRSVSMLPLSIIIVGVGDEDFSEMKTLDGDHAEPRVDSRDIVQFVELRRFLLPDGGWSHELLAKSVLAEVPGQVTAWMKIAGFTPKERLQMSLSQNTEKQPVNGE